MKIFIKKPNNSEMLKLLKSFEEKSLEGFKNNLERKKEGLLIIKLDDKIAGVLKYKNNKDFSRVESFYLLLEKWRGKGVAQKLYEKYEKSLENKKYVEAYVYQSNHRAQGFWKKNGFLIIKESKDNKGKKLYYMKKKLY